MGVVFAAVHQDMGRRVAIKILTFTDVESDEAFQRFRREARLSSRIQHPNAVVVHDFFRTDGNLACLVMELIEGPSLSDIIKGEAPLAPQRVAAVAAQVLEILELAHHLGIVHRDLKPGNVMLTRQGEREHVKVLDFGIAKIADSRFDTAGGPLTQAGMIFGSPQYMAPEQARGDQLDGRSDLYSLGILMYEMLTGAVPFDDPNPMEILVQQVKSRPRLLPGSVPQPLREVVQRALEKEPDRRFRDAREMLEGLRPLVPEVRASGELPEIEPPPFQPIVELIPLRGGTPLRITGSARMGRERGNDLVVVGHGADHVSMRHLELTWRGEELWVRDLNSTNGTYLNGVQVHEAPVSANSTLQLAREGPAYRVTLPFARRVVRDQRPTGLSGQFRRLLTSIGGLIGIQDEYRRRR
jgi:serine/threonine protein kinase